jgi:hypothetical protein
MAIPVLKSRACSSLARLLNLLPEILTFDSCAGISDANKIMLVQVPGFISLLVDVLFLDPDGRSILKKPDERVKAAMQADAAECLAQVALFDAGRELLANDDDAKDALHAMVNGGALTEPSKIAAAGALMSIEGRVHDQGKTRERTESTDGHVMVSCKSVQMELMAIRCFIRKTRADIKCSCQQTNGMSSKRSSGSSEHCRRVATKCGS